MGAMTTPSVSVHTREKWFGSSIPCAGGTAKTRSSPSPPPIKRNHVVSFTRCSLSRRVRLTSDLETEGFGARSETTGPDTSGDIADILPGPFDLGVFFLAAP